MKRLMATVVLLFGLVVSTARAQTASTALQPGHVSALALRSIGPATMSGRIVDLAVVERDPYVIYAASATGGVFKSVNNGITWAPVFEKEGTHSVGAIAVHPVDTAVVWVGTGERANRQSSSWGDGVYKSTDGGRTWTNVGLRDSKHIGRIALHPTSTQIAFVAAMGHLWGPNEERGLYKTTDGGQTWRRTLHVDRHTGVVDVAIDPADANVMYAASYQRRRAACCFDGGGPGSALWKSTDAGETWTRIAPQRASANDPGRVTEAGRQGRRAVQQLEALAARGDTMGAPGPNGLPIGEYGRIGISIYRSDPRIVYVSVEQGYRYNASTEYTQRLAGIYRSEDRGATWTHMSDWNPRPMYASQPLVDPSDHQRIYMQNSFSWSDDGGRTFVEADQSLHGDDRFLWVNPTDSRHVIKADDGGIGISYDRARTWLYVSSLPVSQYYRVATDNAFPFNIYGGLQDNGSWVGPSATFRREGVLNEDWRRIGGGDGFLALADTVDNRTIYAESQYLGLTRLDTRTWLVRDIRPGDPRGHISARKNWDAWGPGTPEPELGNAMAPANWDGPYFISPHDAATIYAATNRVWKSTDRGATWRDLGDHTTGTDRREERLENRRGEDYTASLDDGIPYWPTVSALEESPRRRGELWAGTDDGNLKVSRDDGATWTELSDRLAGLPDRAWISGIEASAHRDGRVYVVANHYRSDDYANYLYRTDDGGPTWTRIDRGLPAERVLRTVREDLRNPDVLWLGTELGLFVSNDAGTTWIELRNNLPTLAINDLTVHPRDNDLVLGTHGRGIWILDNVNAIQELTPAVMAAEAHLFTAEPANQIRYAAEKAHAGDMIFRGANPPEGAILDYWLREAREAGDVAITVHDAAGRRIAEVTPTVRAGVNRVLWDLRHDRLPARAGARAGQRGPAGPLVTPGTYTAQLIVGLRDAERTGQRPRTFDTRVIVREDPRIDVPQAVRAQWTADLLEIAALYAQANTLVEQLLPLARRLPPRKESPGAPPGSAAAREASQPPDQPVLTGRQLADVSALVRQTDELLSRVGGLYGAVSSWVGPLTADQRSMRVYLADKATELAPAVDALVARAGRGGD